MDKNLHIIDRLFLDELEHHEDAPSGDVWLHIDIELNRRNAILYRQKYRMLLKSVVCVVFLLCSLLVGDVLQENLPTGLAENKSTVSIVKDKTEEPVIKQEENNRDEYGITKASDPLTTAAVNKIANFNKSSVVIFDGVTMNNYKPVSDGYGLVYRNKSSALINKRLIVPYGLLLQNKLFAIGLSQNNLVETDSGHISETDRKKNQSKQKHPFFLIPFFSFDHVTGRFQQQYQYGAQDQSDVTKRERPDLSNTVGLLAEYSISNKFSIQSGMLLSNAFTSIGSTQINALQDNSGNYKFKLATSYGLAEITKTGIIPQTGDSILLNGASLTLQYISLPVLAKYNFKQGKVSISGTAGFAINKISRDRIEANYTTANRTEVETINKIEGLRKTFLSLNAGTEINYNLNSKISIGINPVMRYALTPVNQGTPVKTYPVSIGLGATLRIKW